MVSECVLCGSPAFRFMGIEEIPYGVTNPVSIFVQIPYEKCTVCKETFSGHEAEEIRHEAVCRYLNIMPPSELVKIRGNLTIEELAQATNLDPKKLDRWEKSLAYIDPESNTRLLEFSKRDP